MQQGNSNRWDSVANLYYCTNGVDRTSIAFERLAFAMNKLNSQIFQTYDLANNRMSSKTVNLQLKQAAVPAPATESLALVVEQVEHMQQKIKGCEWRTEESNEMLEELALRLLGEQSQFVLRARRAHR